MKRQSSLIQKSNDLEEYKTELAVCIEQKITAYRNDTKKIDELTFQCISALAEVDNAKAELSSKGWLDLLEALREVIVNCRIKSIKIKLWHSMLCEKL